MKTLYLIKHAKSNWSLSNTRDIERPISKKGAKNIKTIGSYLLLRSVVPDIILSSCSLRAQESSDLLAQKLDFHGKTHYLQELYMTPAEDAKEIIMAQDNSANNLFVVGHNPQLSELANMLTDEHINKIPSMGVVALSFEIDDWDELEEVKGRVEFFIYPKQFKYYMPQQIQSTLKI